MVVPTPVSEVWVTVNGAPTEVTTPDAMLLFIQANSSKQKYPLPATPWQELLT